MVGGFSFKLTSKRLEYNFNVNRKITRIIGHSATGKTELMRALTDSQISKSGVFVSCKYNCEIVNDSFFRHIKEDISTICQKIKNHNSRDFVDAMRTLLARNDNTLFFADEDFKSMNTNEFALFCKFTDSFFVLICRNSLCKIPYSYTEIYTVKESGKFHELIPMFENADFLKFCEDRRMIVEDSNSGTC